MNFNQEHLGGGVCAFTSREHTFGHDALLLADFAAPKLCERACDLCCGCGIIPLRWYSLGTGPVEACGVDIQPQAIEQLKKGVEASGLFGRVTPLLADLRQYGRGQNGALDLVTCNPPYQAAGSGKTSLYEPARTARHESAASCTFGEVCAAAARLLKNAGRFCLCHKPERLPALFEELRRHRLEPKRLRLVHKNAESPAWLALIEARLNANPGLIAEPPLLLETPQKNASQA